MSTPADRFHHRLLGLEKKVDRLKNNPAPTVPKYDLTGPPGGLGSIINVSEIGWGFSTTLGNSLTVPIAYQDVQPTDMIWIMTSAPRVPSSGAGPASMYNVTDTQGHVYYTMNQEFAYEDATPLPNIGTYLTFFATDPYDSSSTSGLTIGTDSITANWDIPVFDRMMVCWLIRFTNRSPTEPPHLMNYVPVHSSTVYAATQVTVSIPGYSTIPSDGSLLFGNIIYTRPAGAASLAFGSVSGWNGFVEVRNHSFSSTRQSYSHHQQSGFANALLINSSINPVYEIDQGLLDAGDNITGFNGLGQGYAIISGGSLVPEGNFWKGAAVWLVTNP